MATRLQKRVLSQIAATTALLTLVLSFALPLLDVVSTKGRAFEADHEHGCFIASHDHTICNQFGNQRLTTDDTRPSVIPPRIHAYDAPEPVTMLVTVSVDTPGRPRAPPLL